MAVVREVRWSDEAGTKVDAIKDFIRVQWSEREEAVHLDLLRQFEQLWSSSQMATSGQLFSQVVVAP
jgi:plasmid stabilization system protein ParE